MIPLVQLALSRQRGQSVAAAVPEVCSHRAIRRVTHFMLCAQLYHMTAAMASAWRSAWRLMAHPNVHRGRLAWLQRQNDSSCSGRCVTKRRRHGMRAALEKRHGSWMLAMWHCTNCYRVPAVYHVSGKLDVNDGSAAARTSLPSGCSKSSSSSWQSPSSGRIRSQVWPSTLQQPGASGFWHAQQDPAMT